MAAAMRRLALLAAAAVVVLVLPAAGGTAPGHSALVLGDSLALGTKPYLPNLLPGWRLRQVVDIGFHTTEGVKQVRAYGSSLPHYVVLSLGTNDDPRLVSGFRSSIRSVMAAAGPERCVVWPNIVRPPAVGTTYAGYNRALAAEGRARANLLVVDWVSLARAHPEWLRKDGVHVNAAGYKARAAAIARALASCRV
jgi:lysophospholipase L1-like esterase